LGPLKLLLDRISMPKYSKYPEKERINLRRN